MKILIGGIPRLTTNYANALKSLGAETIVLLPKLPAASFDASLFDGLLLPGGGDIHPSFYGQQNTGSICVDTLLDAQQFFLFHAFLNAHKPILGICKGMQLINVALGGSLIQDLPEAIRTFHAYDRADQFHTTSLIPGTFLHELYGAALTTNSAHHQAVDRLGEHLLPAPYGPGRVIEALYHDSLPVFGVQWHPERMASLHQTTGGESKILRFFLECCLHPAS